MNECISDASEGSKKPPALQLPSTPSKATATAVNVIASHVVSTAMDASNVPASTAATGGVLAKTLKRCLSVPTIHTLPHSGSGAGGTVSSTAMTTRSAAAAAALAKANLTNVICKAGTIAATANDQQQHSRRSLPETPKKYQQLPDSSSLGSHFGSSSSIHIGIPRSNPSSREVSPAPMFNIFAPRARRYSASYSPMGAGGNGVAAGSIAVAPLCITPRVSQLRQEECVDMNSREVNHEREVHSAMQMSQSWEDLTLVAENWSCKSDELSNPLMVALPGNALISSCSSPSPTSNRPNVRLPYGLSPSPTRRTFATRRSMSPIAMRPSPLGPVKRKFELDDNSSSGNWNVYSPPPLKKIFTESRGSSPVGQSPSCPSPDSGTYDGRITPKLFISKLCTSNTNSNNMSACSSPSSSVSCPIDSTATSGICSSSSSSSASSVSGGSEPMCIVGNVDEGVSMADTDDKGNANAAVVVTAMATDLQDEATLMDDIKSETSSIGGCSSISVESSSSDSGAKVAAHYFNKLQMDDASYVSSTGNGGGSSSGSSASTLGQKNFFINKQGLSGPKKFIVNHDNLPNSGSETPESSIKVTSSTTRTSPGVKTRRNTALRLTTATSAATNSTPTADNNSNNDGNDMLANANAIDGNEVDMLIVENKS